MSLLLFIVGAVALMAGVAMAAYGIPINEFSFGNTLIVAGCSLAAGGLVVIGLGAVVAQLQRISEVLSVWTPGRSAVADLFEDRGGLHPMPSENRIPFPPRPQPAVPSPAEPDRGAVGAIAAAATVAAAPAAADLFAGVPSLRNPAAPAEDEKKEEAPATPSWLTARDTEAAKPAAEDRAEPASRFGRTTDFDSLWPEKRAAAEPVVAPEPEPEPEPAQEEEDTRADEQETAQYEAFDRPEPEEVAEAAPSADQPEVSPEDAPADVPQAVAVLKSGVVDGMAYTLYVDGSIEAELPQGTLRFSSINDLRNYLENNA